jgi:hypothetical protein
MKKLIIIITALLLAWGVAYGDDCGYTMHELPDAYYYNEDGRICKAAFDILYFKRINEIRLEDFIIKGWKAGQDCISIEYKGKIAPLGDGCGRGRIVFED